MQDLEQEDVIVRVTTDHLAARFGGVERTVIEQRVRVSTRAWLREARVRTFVAILVERHVRRDLEHEVALAEAS